MSDKDDEVCPCGNLTNAECYSTQCGIRGRSNSLPRPADPPVAPEGRDAALPMRAVIRRWDGERPTTCGCPVTSEDSGLWPCDACCDMLTAATLAQLAAQAGEEIETLLPDHWFACLVNRPEKLGGPAKCDCNRGKLAAHVATLTAQRDEAVAALAKEREGFATALNATATACATYMNRALDAESALAASRAEALEEAAKECDISAQRFVELAPEFSIGTQGIAEEIAGTLRVLAARIRSLAPAPPEVQP